MTPEQRLDRIESIIEKQSAEIDKHNAVIDKHNTAIDKHNAAIGNLIVVSRTVLTSIQESAVHIQQLREAQAATDEKLNILIDTVDRVIRERGKE